MQLQNWLVIPFKCIGSAFALKKTTAFHLFVITFYRIVEFASNVRKIYTITISKYSIEMRSPWPSLIFYEIFCRFLEIDTPIFHQQIDAWNFFSVLILQSFNDINKEFLAILKK